jgi:hypothetical protein
MVLGGAADCAGEHKGAKKQATVAAAQNLSGEFIVSFTQ